MVRRIDHFKYPLLTVQAARIQRTKMSVLKLVRKALFKRENEEENLLSYLEK